MLCTMLCTMLCAVLNMSPCMVSHVVLHIGAHDFGIYTTQCINMHTRSFCLELVTEIAISLR